MRLLLILLMPLSIFCQNEKYPLPPNPLNDEGKFVRTAVVEFEGLSAEDLHQRAKVFISERFEVAEIEIRQDADLVIIADVQPAELKRSVMSQLLICQLQIKIEFREGRYKMTIHNGFTEYDTSNMQLPPDAVLKYTIAETITPIYEGRGRTKKNRKWVIDLLDFCSKFENDLKSAMSVEVVDDDW